MRIPCKQLVLACGHSARDTFRMLQRAGLVMEPKSFSIGVRIEHLQRDIDRAQYGRDAGHPALGAADYKLVVHLPDGRSVYTFCMCPGGQVVAAASEEFGVVVNGMSRYARSGENSNAALLVGVTPADFPSSDPLAGTVFQRRIEQAAFGEAHEMGGEAWQAPAQTVGDFLAMKAGNPSKKVQPSYSRGVVWCDLREVLPEFAIDALAEALPLLGRKLKGFDDPQAVMTGVETRSSSPVRIVRDENTLQAFTAERKKKARPRDIARGHGSASAYRNVKADIGIYPCGEGPGYAGGIMSAATDGLRVAQKVTEDFRAAHEARKGAEPMASALGCADACGEGIGLASGGPFSDAVEALRRGEAVLFPTDTVYGVGVSVAHAASAEAVSKLKGRPADKPVAWLVDDMGALDLYGQEVPDYAYDFAREQWPGALTLVVKASNAVPEAFASRAGTIGLRMPANQLVRDLIGAVGAPLAVTSANLAGNPAPASFDAVDPAIIDAVAAVIEQGPTGSGTASTVIDCTGENPVVLRS